MHVDSICDGSRIYESTTKHSLQCQSLLGGNELVTYIPDYRDLFRKDEQEQVYIARLIKDNIGRLPLKICSLNNKKWLPAPHDPGCCSVLM